MKWNEGALTLLFEMSSPEKKHQSKTSGKSNIAGRTVLGPAVLWNKNLYIRG